MEGRGLNDSNSNVTQLLLDSINCDLRMRTQCISKYSVRRLLGSLWADKESDNNNRMIQLTKVFCVLFRYNDTVNI
jgi:hypothetical protein